MLESAKAWACVLVLAVGLAAARDARRLGPHPLAEVLEPWLWLLLACGVVQAVLWTMIDLG